LALTLPPLLLLAVGRARKSYITIEHQAIHSQLFTFRSRRLREGCNWLVGELIGLLLWVPEPDMYRATHSESHHKAKDLATPRDRDGAPFFRLGFLPGMPEAHYWRLLWQTLIDPRFYLRQANERLTLSLFTASYRRVALSWLFGITLLTLSFTVS